ncbi:MAG: cytochrome c oxidase subunit II [Gemmatimonadota bacterium]
MTRIRPRQLARALSGIAALLVLASCGNGANYPNSTFLSHTEFNRDLTSVWDTMLGWGTVVFVIVEAILLVAIIRYRRRPGGPEPKHVHGNTPMEIAWTVLPLFILAIIAVPTVRNIWKYQGDPEGDVLQVRVIGHQWWWEFRYPQYNLTTANELYLPIGRTVRFELTTADVIHSFWIPALGGKRDLVNNRTNYLWFTPDSVTENAFNGSCNEYCGSSHANMKFRAYTVSAENFESWATHQAANAVYPAPAPAAPATTNGGTETSPVSNAAAVASQVPATPPPPPVTQSAGGYEFPAARLPDHAVPRTPIPAGVRFDESLLAAGDAQRGMEVYSRSACIGCHRVRGNPMSAGILGPDLTHVASRHTIAAGLFPNDARHMAYWIKNAVALKPGAKMNVMGSGEYEPMLGRPVTTGGLSDAQIADIVAYLRTLR